MSCGNGSNLHPTYNQLDYVNLRDFELPADERSTNILISNGDKVYGATSGFKCHIFAFDGTSNAVKILASINGPNTVMKGMALDDDTLYFGTMLTKKQIWWSARKKGDDIDPEDANLYPIDESWMTGHLYKITEINSSNPKISDLGVPVKGEGIHTMAMDTERGLVYGLTYPSGRFFIYDTQKQTTEVITFGTTCSEVSNHMVGLVEVVKDLTEHTIGEVEFNNKLIARAMHVMKDGTLYTSGWRGQILKYDPRIENPQERFSAVGYIPSVPGRQHWNRIDDIEEYRGILYMGTSDGYIIRLDPKIGEMRNYGKPVRAIDVKAMVFSSLDGKLYGFNGGDTEGMSRFWCLDPKTGTYDVDYPVLPQFSNRRRPVGDIVCREDGALVISQTTRVANLCVLTPGEPGEWEKSGVLEEPEPGDPYENIEKRDLYVGHKQLSVDVYPIPSALHGGTGYTAIQADREGKIYIGGAYYGKHAPFMQLDPASADWRLVFSSDRLTHRYGRGMGIPGKIHTKLRLGSDGKIYGAMKQGYEYGIRSEIGEAPEGERGSQYTCHFFNYDPATDTVTDMGPGLSQEGITAFHVDVDRGHVYGVSVPGVHFLVYDLKKERVWDAGTVAQVSPARYMALDYSTGRVYHKGEVTPEGRQFMTVWDPDEFRLRDIEIAVDGDLDYRHSYAICCGPDGGHKLYGSADGKLFEMDLKVREDGKIHVRPLCPVALENEVKAGYMYSIEKGPDDCIYWGCNYGDHGPLPIAIFKWNPATEEKTYLGTCALGGEWIYGGMNQGICFDKDGNMAIHILYSQIRPEQQKLWKVSDDFHYEDIVPQTYYLGYPTHYKGTYYSVFYVKNATKIGN